MTPGPGQFAVTIRIERPDGQFVTTATLVPGDMLTSADRLVTQSAETARVMAGFVSAYRRAAELPDCGEGAGRAALIGRIMDAELPRFAEALKRLGE